MEIHILMHSANIRKKTHIQENDLIKYFINIYRGTCHYAMQYLT